MSKQMAWIFLKRRWRKILGVLYVLHIPAALKWYYKYVDFMSWYNALNIIALDMLVILNVASGVVTKQRSWIEIPEIRNMSQWNL